MKSIENASDKQMFRNMPLEDYELFNKIYSENSPAKYGRDNYVKGEQEKQWNELSKHFKLPKYEPNKYSFGVNNKDKTIELYQNGVAGSGGFGEWLVKPKSLGILKRKK